jgi:hypothetical protein
VGVGFTLGKGCSCGERIIFVRLVLSNSTCILSLPWRSYGDAILVVIMSNF